MLHRAARPRRRLRRSLLRRSADHWNLLPADLPGPQAEARELRVLHRRASRVARGLSALRPLPPVVASQRDLRRRPPPRRGRRARAADRRWRDADFDALAVHASTARRQFQKRFGMTFVEYARARRLGSAFKAIRSGERVIDAQLDAGFESPERLSRRVRADHGRAAGEPRDARVVRRLARHAARPDDRRRRRPRAASARVRRPARVGARDRAVTTAAEGRHRAGPDSRRSRRSKRSSRPTSRAAR